MGASRLSGRVNTLPPEPGCAPWTAAAPRTAIDQPGPKRQGRLDIADAIVDAWTEALWDGELALEYLASPTNGGERIALR